MIIYKMRGPERSLQPVIRWSNVLDGSEYRFMLVYRKRADCWDMQFATSSGEIVIDGVQVVEGWPLNAPFSDPRLPPGQVICVNTINRGQPPTRWGWRDDCFLRYIPYAPIVKNNQLHAEPAPVILP